MLKIQQISPKLYRCLLYGIFHNSESQNAGLVYINKSTASGTKYARNSVIFPHRMTFVRGEVYAVMTGPKLNLIKKFGERAGGGGRVLKPKQQTVSNEVNTKLQLSTQCRACGTINISKYVNIFLSTNPTTFILSSLVSEFCQRI